MFWIDAKAEDELINECNSIVISSFLKRPTDKYFAFNTIFNMLNNKLYQYQTYDRRLRFNKSFVFLSGKGGSCLPFGDKIVIHLTGGRITRVFRETDELKIGRVPMFNLPTDNMIRLKNTENMFILADKSILSEISEEQIEEICNSDSIEEIRDRLASAIKENPSPFLLVNLPKRKRLLGFL